MWAVNWASTKNIIELELSLYCLKRTIIICKSYDLQGKIISVVLSSKMFVFKNLLLFTPKYSLNY